MMATLLVTLLAATHAQAQENEGGFRGFFKNALHGKSSSQTTLPKYQKECAACHQGAERGRFDEDEVHIPSQ